MGKGIDLELIRQILVDDKIHLSIGKITKVTLLPDRSELIVECDLVWDSRHVVAIMAWESTGPESGDFDFPIEGELVMIAMMEGDDDHAYVVKRLTSKDEKIPNTAIGGHRVVRARSGKKLWLTSSTRINLSLGDTEPTEPLVLGNTFKTALSSILQTLIDQGTQLSTQAVQISTMNTQLGLVCTQLSVLSTAIGLVTTQLAIEPVLTGAAVYSAGTAATAAASAAFVADQAIFTAIKAQIDIIKAQIDILKGQLTAQKSSPVDDRAMLSDLSFTEK